MTIEKTFTEPGKRKRPVHWEALEQKALFRWANALIPYYPEFELLYAVPNSGGYTGNFKSNMLRVVEMKRQGTKPGQPDINLDVARGVFHGLRIELKPTAEHKSKISKEQEERVWLLRDQGYRAEFRYGWVEAARTICVYLGYDPKKMGV